MSDYVSNEKPAKSIAGNSTFNNSYRPLSSSIGAAKAAAPAARPKMPKTIALADKT